MSIETSEVKEIIAEMLPEIKALRHDLHRHPESAYEEVRTAAQVVKHLKRLKIPHRTKVGGTGVVGVIKGKKRGKCIALRADMDALNLQEKNRFKHRSVHKGKMHACGHDGHTANLVGVAHVLSRLRRHLKGSVKLIFQPAEEGGAGAAAMLKDGAFRKAKPDVIYALHCGTQVPVGSIAFSAGPCSAASDRIRITIKGKGAHAAHPHKSVDPIVISAAVIQALQTIKSRRSHPLHPLVVTIGTIHGGTASNIIPEEVTLTGTWRSYDAKLRKAVPRHLKRIVRGIARAMGGDADVQCTFDYPSVVNDAASCAFLEKLGTALLGKRKVLPQEPTMGGEDFSFFLEHAPGVFFRLGIGGDCGAPHSPTFDFNDDALETGMLVMSMLALHWLEQH